MTKHCQIPKFIAKLHGGSACGVAYIGGSVTLASGASNTAETSWRALFQKYLYSEFHRKYHCHVGEIFCGLASCSSDRGAFMVGRNLLSAHPALTFVEFSLNDRHVADRTLATKGIEGIIRQLLMSKTPCEVIILGSGCNPNGRTADGKTGPVDHSLHRKVAEHYGLPFIDLQDYIYRRLEERGQTWEAVMSDVEHDPCYHLNDEGQRIYFEAIRDAFLEQITLYEKGDCKSPIDSVPDPLLSDELQFVKLIDPSKRNPSITLEGKWDKKPAELVPWYYDNVLMGAPQSKMILRFTGTAAVFWGLMSANGLKLKAMLDGDEIAGPFLNWPVEFGKGFMLAHGLPHGEHVLELTVGSPRKRQNKYPNPTGDVAYLGVACKKAERETSVSSEEED